jgi:sterol desaturase/sphingolipid hydroxylase (fatty acid hydroxylase superfamily)
VLELLTYVTLMLLSVAIFCREVIAPASRNRCDRRWLVLAACSGIATAGTAVGIGVLCRETIGRAALFHPGRVMPDVAVGLLSFVLTSFVFYWWHRATHRFDGLWRLFHQLHHSAKRVEALTAYYAHPLDSAAAVMISALSSYLVLGASPLAAATALLLTGAFDLFVHADVVTPRWLGWIVQRPEMHTVHHAEGHHAQNYGLPVWDLLFGTWTNPAARVQRLGFDGDRSSLIFEMLMFRDVHRS